MNETPRPAQMTPNAPDLLAELHAIEWSALTPALCETVRLLESDRFDELTETHIREIANYRAVDLGDETFFGRAFSPGKEAAASLAFARMIGRELVLGDLYQLRSAVGCGCDRRAA